MSELGSLTDLMGLVVEKIDMPIRDTLAFVKIVKSKLGGLVSKIEKAYGAVARLGEDGSDLLSDRVWVDKDTFYGVPKLKDHLGTFEEMMKGMMLLDTDSVHDAKKLMGYAKSQLEGFKELASRFSSVGDDIRGGAESLKDDWKYNNENSERWGQQFPKKTLELVLELPGVFDQLVSLSRRYVEKMSIQQGKPQETEKIETLYHASINAKSIFKNGFSTGPTRHSGLGTVSERLISFTYDLYVAKEIARSFKEAVMIANGKVKAVHIADWARREGVMDDVKKALRSNIGLDVSEVQTPPQVFAMYRYYLTFQKKRYDPFYSGDEAKLMQTFGRVSASSVGVIQCKCRMEGAEYFGAEREYRLPPEAVVSIDKFIK